MPQGLRDGEDSIRIRAAQRLGEHHANRISLLVNHGLSLPMSGSKKVTGPRIPHLVHIRPRRETDMHLEHQGMMSRWREIPQPILAPAGPAACILILLLHHPQQRNQRLPTSPSFTRKMNVPVAAMRQLAGRRLSLRALGLVVRVPYALHLGTTGLLAHAQILPVRHLVNTSVTVVLAPKPDETGHIQSQKLRVI